MSSETITTVYNGLITVSMVIAVGDLAVMYFIICTLLLLKSERKGVNNGWQIKSSVR